MRLNTIFNYCLIIWYIFHRTQSGVYDWVRKSSLQSTSGRNPEHLALDGPVIGLDDVPYRLYATIIPDVSALSSL